MVSEKFENEGLNVEARFIESQRDPPTGGDEAGK